MKDTYKGIIYNWVKDNFGESEAADPSWNIEALSEELAKHAWQIHSLQQEEYDLEDIDAVAEDNNIELTKEERELVLHRYKKLEDSNLEFIQSIIKEVKGE